MSEKDRSMGDISISPEGQSSSGVRKPRKSSTPNVDATGDLQPTTPKPTPSELRAAQYEKSLTKGHRPKYVNKEKKDPEKLAKKRSEKRAHSTVLREKIIKMIEGGLQLSEYQARKAFSVYLQCLLQRLSDFDVENGSDLSQIDLVLKFLQKAALSLREPYYLKAPNGRASSSFGSSVAITPDAGRIAVGADCRLSSPRLRDALCEGLVRSGLHVVEPDVDLPREPCAQLVLRLS